MKSNVKAVLAEEKQTICTLARFQEWSLGGLNVFCGLGLALPRGSRGVPVIWSLYGQSETWVAAFKSNRDNAGLDLKCHGLKEEGVQAEPQTFIRLQCPECTRWSARTYMSESLEQWPTAPSGLVVGNAGVQTDGVMIALQLWVLTERTESWLNPPWGVWTEPCSRAAETSLHWAGCGV